MFILLALGHGCALALAPSIHLIGIGFWWNANTIAHNFIHRPFFRQRRWNLLFSAYLSVLLGIPQRLWHDRHLAHHAQSAWRLRLSSQLVAEFLLVGVFWAILLGLAPRFILQVYWPGCLLGLSLCFLQGHYEHARGTVSHYGALYNWLLFNDGYHVEHHARPAAHWSRLPEERSDAAATSRWPPILRWLELLSLDSLECLVLKAPCLQRFVLRRHEAAFRKLLPQLPNVRHVGIVGGGLFPRTALLCRRLWPHAQVTILEASLENTRTAKAFLGGGAKFVHSLYDGSAFVEEFDVLVIPLSFIGDRRAVYRRPGAPAVLVHDWIWRRHGPSAIISWTLLKRLNLVWR